MRLAGERFVIEMVPVWSSAAPRLARVCEGAVGLGWLRPSALFRYEVHCWRDGCIADRAEAVASPLRLSDDEERSERLLGLAAMCPAPTWGRDELNLGEMWNSNSVTAWLLARSGHALEGVHPPPGGRAPGWSAGRALAAREMRGVLHPTRPSLPPSTPCGG